MAGDVQETRPGLGEKNYKDVSTCVAYSLFTTARHPISTTQNQPQMKSSTSAAIFLSLWIPAVMPMATNHTMCYNYFMEKDGCVFSATASDQRCLAPLKEQNTPVQTFAYMPVRSPTASRSESSRSERRHDTITPSLAIAGGKGICGHYNSTSEPGVCLWTGVEPVTLESAGWLNRAKRSNCGKIVRVHRKGKPDTAKSVRVLDGCDFGTKSIDPGCYDIALSVKLFEQFNPTEDEKKDGLIHGGVAWELCVKLFMFRVSDGLLVNTYEILPPSTTKK
ncbi:hypothetical protein MJO28_004856 [Puccinia striiformis f. sp. tritici]|uniref:Uncharacterized protein n=1 Tax=Puccinia striiformis f. sp. tritici TaxID=168172 RepID=A0ACC0EKK7_9BASI|nr:hypothetical protein MJO28_004856 [Puccinia striiformis f. sp. tritici]